MEWPIIIYFYSILPFLLKSRGYPFRYPRPCPSIYFGISPRYLFSFPCYLGNIIFDIPWSHLEIRGISVSISPSVPLDIFGNIPSLSIFIPLLSREYLFWCPLRFPWDPRDISFDIPYRSPRYQKGIFPLSPKCWNGGIPSISVGNIRGITPWDFPGISRE